MNSFPPLAPSQARARPPIKMLFTGWEISKAPADSVSTSQVYFFLEEKHGWTVNPSCSLTVLAKCPCSPPPRQGSARPPPKPPPRMSTDVASPEPHINLEIAELLRKEPTTFKKAFTTPSLPSTHVTEMVKMRVDEWPTLFSLSPILKCPSLASSFLS